MERYVVYADWLVNYVLKETYIFAKRLEKLGWNCVALSNVTDGFFKDKKCVILCITYIEKDILSFKTKDNILIYKVDDLFPYYEMTRKCIDACDYIIGPYTHLFPEIPHEALQTKPKIQIGYSAVPEYYEITLFNETPKQKIFVSGAVNEVYPLRQYISSDSEFTEYIERLCHPGYIQETSNPLHEIVHDKYYSRLNEYLCCFCDCLTYGYILCKIFEITSVGSLLLVEDKISTELNKMGFYDTINCIMCNKENLHEKISWILNPDNRNEVDKIRKEGMYLTRRSHTTDNRVSLFTDFLEKNVIWNDNLLNMTDIDTSPESIIPFIREFLELYKSRPNWDNSGGMKAPQCFWTWYFLKKVNPQVVIESGIWYGLSTWLIEKTCPTARIISIDPCLHYRKYISDRVEYTTVDFNNHNWTTELGGQDVCKNTFAFIDDHQNNFERLNHAYTHSIGHIVFEDNYPTTHGDVLSLKKILSNTYHILDVNHTRTSCEIPSSYKDLVKSMCDYFECPIPYLDTPTTRWGDTFEEHGTKPPIFDTLRDDIDLTQFKEDQLNYTFIAYVKLKC